MLPELFALAFIGSAIYGGFHLTRLAAAQQHQTRRPLPQQTYSPATRQAARNLQIGLQQLRSAPDFRRAASFVTHAVGVPHWFRQRQYHRFRPLLVEHLTRLLNEGATCDSLMPGLVQLVSGLGIAPFEADYIRNEAESRLTRQAAQTPDFGQRLRETQATYRSRMRTLESMRELDDETREQLLEQEKIRFQDQLRAISGGEGAGHEP